jgi:hypothetical protein
VEFRMDCLCSSERWKILPQEDRVTSPHDSDPVLQSGPADASLAPGSGNPYSQDHS